MDKSLIEKKSENLLKINMHDECIFLLKIKNKNFIDLLEIYNIESINSLFSNNNSIPLKIPSFIDIEKIINKLSNNYEDVSLFLEDLKKVIPELNLSNEIIDYINLNKKDNIKWLISNINKYANDINDDIIKISSIYKQSKKNINKKGIETLFIARYFVYYKDEDNNYIKAPLIFLPINIDLKNSIIYKKDEWIINEKLLLFLSKSNNKDIDLNKKYNLQEIIELIDYLTGHKFTFNNYASLYNDFTKQEFINYINDHNYEIHDEIILGIFSINDAILYKEINQLKQNDVFLDPFDEQINNFLTKKELVQQEITNKSLLMNNNKIDIYQRYAIRCALNQNTIIYGPPGTGKSQTISNLLINILVQNNTSLIVSEKMTALNVILKRLENLTIFFLPLTHYDDKDSFYKTFKKLKEVVDNDWFYENYDLDKDLKKEELILKKLDEKQFDINLKKYFDLSNKFAAKNKESLQDFKNYFDINNKLNSKIQIFKDNEFCLIYYKKISDELRKYQIDENNFFDNAIQFAKKIGFTNYENYLSVAKSLSKVQEKIPNLLKINIDLNLQNVINSINNLKNSNVISLYDLNYLKNNFFNLKELIQKIIKMQNFIPVELKNKTFTSINTFYNHISSLNDEKNIAFKLDKFIKNEDYTEDIKLAKKIFYREKGINEPIKTYLKFVSDNIDILNEDIRKYIKYYDVLFSDSAWYLYIKELNDPLFINYFKNRLYLFDVNYIKYFIEFDINFYDCKLYLQLQDLHKKISEYNEINQDHVIDEIFENDNNEYKLLTSDILKLVFDLCVVRLRMKLSKLDQNDKKEAQIVLASGLLTKRPDIFRFINEHHKILKEIFLVWLGTPENIARNLPLEHNMFDYGIYDESSQVYLERIYSIIYRTNIKIVAGDDKQIQPISYFSSIQEYDPDENYDLNYDTDAAKSLLEKAKSLSWNEFMLKNHYRSNNEELIKFSNKYFYNNELDFASYNFDSNEHAIQNIEVDGVFKKNGTNIQEANKTIDVLLQYYDKYDSIIVITSNVSQMNLIESLISKNEILSQASEDKINVINLENIQGEEADLVIYSFTYAKKEETNLLSSNFGPINFKDGKFRINVAITRAKKEMIIIKSIKSSDIRNDSQNESIDILKKYFYYIENISNKQITDINHLDEENVSSSYELFDNLFSKMKDKYSVLTNYLIGSKKVDYVLKNKDTQKIDLIIFIDDFSNNINEIDWLQSVDFQRFLENRGYKTYRINIFEWLLNSNKITQDINKKIG